MTLEMWLWLQKLPIDIILIVALIILLSCLISLICLAWQCGLFEDEEEDDDDDEENDI